ncbi:MAG: iron-containing alcohol dehydrogenase, partial [Deltaproteobacteria bacterium]
MADRGYFTRKLGGDKVFSVEAPKIKFGNGVLNELGEDAKSLGMRRVAVFTDRIVAEQESLEIAVKSLEKAGMECQIYNEVEVEPTDRSFKAG